jgi:hypothetical protein
MGYCNFWRQPSVPCFALSAGAGCGPCYTSRRSESRSFLLRSTPKRALRNTAGAGKPTSLSLVSRCLRWVFLLSSLRESCPGYFHRGARSPAVHDGGGCAASRTRIGRSSWFTIVNPSPRVEVLLQPALLLFLLIGRSPRILSRLSIVIHRWASHAIRRSAPWDWRYFRIASPSTQYIRRGVFAAALRRVFGGSVFRAREEIHIAPAGDLQAGTNARPSSRT